MRLKLEAKNEVVKTAGILKEQQKMRENNNL